MDALEQKFVTGFVRTVMKMAHEYGIPADSIIEAANNHLAETALSVAKVMACLDNKNDSGDS